jgi:hypothetical protein
MTSRISWTACLPIVTALSLAACGGGSSGAPKSLSLSGEKVPVSEVTGAYTQMCGVTRQAQTDPAGVAAPFANAQTGLNVLATVLAKDHGQESQRLLQALATFESQVGQQPPPTTLPQSADNLQQTAKQGLQALKITPPSC